MLTSKGLGSHRPTYLECPTIINELADAMEASETSELAALEQFTFKVKNHF